MSSRRPPRGARKSSRNSSGAGKPARRSSVPDSWKVLFWPIAALLIVTGGLAWLLLHQPEPFQPKFETGLASRRPLIPVRPSTETAVVAIPRSKPPVPRKPFERQDVTPAHQSVGVLAATQRPEIAIVIDDVGVDRHGAEGAIALPAAVTLAFLPYARDVEALAARAQAAGHELLVHMPMEPMDGRVNPGPNALLTGLPSEELRRRLDWNLSRFGGYMGVNNHMGSKFTADPAAMKLVIEELKRRNLMFLDSRTTALTQGAKMAAAEGEAFAERDVFLDNDQAAGNVRAQLAQLEAKARQNGRAVAIGHPHAVTLATLAQWLPTAEARGFKLVPISQMMSPDNRPR